MRYEAPTTTKEAAALLAAEKGNAYVLAGGTDLLVRLRSGLIDPDLVVDIKRIAATQGISKTANGGFRIGAGTPCAVMGENAALKKAWPGIVEGANLIGSDQIQGRCTVIGNLCNASPAADSVPAMVTAGAKVAIVGPNGRRTAAIDKIVTGPGQLSLAKGEVIEAVTLPKQAPRSADAYLRFTPRTEMDIAVCSAAVWVSINRGVVTDARVALGAVAPTVVKVPAAAKAIIGTKLDDDALQALAEACEAACNPIDDKRGTVEFRTEVAGVLARRAAKIAFTRAGGK